MNTDRSNRLAAMPYCRSGVVMALCVVVFLFGGAWCLSMFDVWPAKTMFFHPIGILPCIIGLAVLVILVGDWLEYRQRVTTLAAFQRGDDKTWVQQAIDESVGKWGRRRTIEQSLDALEEDRKSLNRKLDLRWLSLYLIPIAVLPLPGLAVGLKSLDIPQPPGALLGVPPSFFKLFGPCMIATLEAVIIGLLACWLRLSWSGLLDNWHKKASEIEKQRDTELLARAAPLSGSRKQPERAPAGSSSTLGGAQDAAMSTGDASRDSAVGDNTNSDSLNRTSSEQGRVDDEDDLLCGEDSGEIRIIKRPATNTDGGSQKC